MISEVREQLAALTDPDVGQGAVFRAVAAGQKRDSAEREQTRWQDERDRYDQMLRALGETAPGE